MDVSSNRGFYLALPLLEDDEGDDDGDSHTRQLDTEDDRAQVDIPTCLANTAGIARIALGRTYLAPETI